MSRPQEPMSPPPSRLSRASRVTRGALARVGIAAVLGAQLLDVHDHAARADAPPGRYTAGADGSIAWVKDELTGLVWKKAEEPGTFTWAAAKTQCVTPWRLPSVGELLSLVDETRTAVPVIDATFFPGASSGNFWSSSPDATSAGANAWDVDFGTGADFNDDPTTPARVRCVR